MPPANDPVQRVSEAIVAIVSANATVRTIADRTTNLIVRWKRRKLKGAAMPLLAYVAGPAEVAGGLGETYDVDVTMRAVAESGATANALLKAAVEALTTAAFTAASCNAVVLDATYDNPPDDDGESSDNANAVIAEVDLVINLTM